MFVLLTLKNNQAGIVVRALKCPTLGTKRLSTFECLTRDAPSFTRNLTIARKRKVDGAQLSSFRRKRDTKQFRYLLIHCPSAVEGNPWLWIIQRLLLWIADWCTRLAIAQRLVSAWVPVLAGWRETTNTRPKMALVVAV